MASHVVSTDDLEAAVPYPELEGTETGKSGFPGIPMLAKELASKAYSTVPFIRPEPSRWSKSPAKRGFDVLWVILFLPLVLPILFVVALAVRFTSRGPILFTQKRVGRFGRLFTIIKFRTLVHSPESKRATVTTDGSEHFTPVGSFLRRWKLDELPQILNVLRGDMSLVGVRPKLPEHQISDIKCRPGITGAATLVFAREGAFLADVPKSQLDVYYRDVVLPTKWRLDITYMAQATFLSDLRIIINSVIRRWNDSARADLLRNAFDMPDRVKWHAGTKKDSQLAFFAAGQTVRGDEAQS